jgi:dTDP-4-amino-4,6-dideoxygalactose transaminase
MLVQGKYVQLLEESFTYYHGAKNAIAAANGTATLHLALLALNIGPGDEVIVPAFSFIATANVVELVGARCVFVDIDLLTFNIDVARLEEKITGLTKGIIPVHQFGLCCNIEEVCAIAAKHNVQVIEDAACALGATYNLKKAGTFGIFGSFSLHPRKVITAGEGGVLLTNDDELARRLRQMRNHGIDTESGKTEFVAAGFNYRLTDLQAALAWSQLNRVDEILAKKSELAQLYLSSINNPKIALPHVPSACRHSWQTFHVLLNNGLEQQEVIQNLKTQGIGANYGAQCIPAQVYYQQKYALDSAALFPHAWKAYTQGLALPLFETLTEADVLKIAETVNRL